MVSPITVWFGTAIFVIVIIVVRLIFWLVAYIRGSHRFHVIEFGSEREELWIPGDIELTSDSEDEEV